MGLYTIDEDLLYGAVSPAETRLKNKEALNPAAELNGRHEWVHWGCLVWFKTSLPSKLTNSFHH